MTYLKTLKQKYIEELDRPAHNSSKLESLTQLIIELSRLDDDKKRTKEVSSAISQFINILSYYLSSYKEPAFVKDNYLQTNALELFVSLTQEQLEKLIIKFTYLYDLFSNCTLASNTEDFETKHKDFKNAIAEYLERQKPEQILEIRDFLYNTLTQEQLERLIKLL